MAALLPCFHQAGWRRAGCAPRRTSWEMDARTRWLGLILIAALTGACGDPGGDSPRDQSFEQRLYTGTFVSRSEDEFCFKRSPKVAPNCFEIAPTANIPSTLDKGDFITVTWTFGRVTNVRRGDL